MKEYQLIGRYVYVRGDKRYWLITDIMPAFRRIEISIEKPDKDDEENWPNLSWVKISDKGTLWWFV